jgi:hypothetical protein
VLWNYYSTGEVWLLIGRYLLRLEKLGKLWKLFRSVHHI